jgi:uncharacterized membrane protein YqjE
MTRARLIAGMTAWPTGVPTGSVRAPAKPVRLPAVQSRPMPATPGYRTLLSSIRANVRTYIRKQLELPRQEIAEIVKANLRAAIWFGVAAAFAFAFLIALVVLVIVGIGTLLRALGLDDPLGAAALLAMVLFAIGMGLTGYVGYRKLELRGPTRTINSVKETIRWARARLLGRSAS